MALAILFGTFLLLAAGGMPVAFALGLSTIAAVLLIGDLPLLVVAQRMYTGIDSYTLLAIPFFLLAGGLMSAGGIAARLIQLARAMLGHLRGGLAIASTFASIIFSGVSGSAAADVSAIGSVVMKPMIREGYEPGWVAALQASCGVLGPIIPPSILMIVYAAITNVSVGALFLAGVIPGLVIGLTLMGMAWHYAGKHNIPRTPFAGFKALRIAAMQSIPALLAPIIIIAGIVGGVFTSTEAGVVAVVYVLVVSLWWYRELAWRDLPEILTRTGFLTATLMFVVATSSAFSYVLAYYDAPEIVLSAMMALTSDRYVALTLILLLIFVIGTVVDVIPAALILVPVVHPLAIQFGYDPVHFALLMVIALQVGGLTPPVGVLLFIACNVGGVSASEANRFVWPFVYLMFAVTLVLGFVPGLVMWLPRLFFAS